MTDVLIRHCTLRVVRRGGWSWGPEPRRLLRGAVEALPALLAAQLAESLPPDLEGEIRQPLVLRVPVREKDLLRLAGGGLAGGLLPDLPLGERLAAAVAAALAETPPGRTTERTEAETGARSDPPAPPAPARDRLAARLLAWHREGVLGEILALLPPEVLNVLRHRLLPAVPPARAPAVDEAVAAFLGRRLAELRQTEAQLSPSALALRLAAEAAAGLGLVLGGPLLAAAVNRLLPPAPPPEKEASPLAAAAEPAPPPAGEAPPVPVPHAGVPWAPAAEPTPGLRPLLEGEVHVPSALPWLLLGPLARMGYLDSVAACLELAGVAALAPCFAAGLAMKVLPPPVRGWRRGPAAAVTAAVFAGLAEPLPEPAIVRFSRRVEASLGLPDADLARATLAGREAGAPLLLFPAPDEAGGGLLTFDPAGLFPVAWEMEAAALTPLVEAAGSPVLLVPEATAAPDLLAALDAAGLSFLTPARPARGEPWTRFAPAGAERLWGNRRPRPSAALRREVARLAESAARAEELARELAARRPAVALAPGAVLDRSLTLAAASALGTIAWTLWREREPTDPLLALERFADLDARVRFDRHRIRVRLPLGKRHRDLYEHGLLASVRGVPWLGRRVVEISGG